jgi:hypothetical protein
LCSRCDICSQAEEASILLPCNAGASDISLDPYGNFLLCYWLAPDRAHRFLLVMAAGPHEDHTAGAPAAPMSPTRCAPEDRPMNTLATSLSAAALGIFAVALVACPLSSGDDDDAAETRSFEELCPINCEQQELCYGLQGLTMQECIDQCIDWRTEDLDRMGDTCDGLLFDLRECEYALSCEDWEIFLDGPGNEGDPCADEMQAFHFDNDCMGGAD